MPTPNSKSLANLKRGGPGRPKGQPNKATAEVRELAQKLFDESYWQRTKAKIQRDSLNPMIERTLLAYAYGEPKQTHDIHATVTAIAKVVHEHRSRA